MSNNKLILHFLCLCNALLSIKSNIIVNTITGPVKGKYNEYGDISYYSFEGIPYAKPPLGDLRFRPPVPIAPWFNVLDASDPGPVCPQSAYLFQRSEMDENCLFLNVYVPITDSDELMPVVFYVHGGYYIAGSGRSRPTIGPQLILQKNIIVVTTNYRLGALGFLSIDNVDASGNMGLKDVLLASKWMKNSILNFGGDPNQICLFGSGTGGDLAHYLLLTDKTTGIFQSAIICSGSALSYRALQINPKDKALKLARQLGINRNDSSWFKKLKEIDAFDIVDAEDYIITNNPRRGFVFLNFFSPAIEIPSPNALITKNPLDILLTEGLIQNVPIITGFNYMEGLEIFFALKQNPHIVDKLNENFELCIPSNIQYPPGSQERRDLAASIRKFYFNGGNISIVNTQNYINLITDTAYTYAIDSWIEVYKSRFSSSLYYYVFKFNGQLNWGKLIAGINYPGMCHGDELGYVFVTNVTEHKLQNLNDKSQYVLASVLDLLRNFASFGNPTPPAYGDFQWIETGSNRNYVVVADPVTNVNEPPLKERLRFWYREYAKYHEYERFRENYGSACK